MGQKTEIVLPLIDAELADKIEEIEYLVLGKGFRLLFNESPPKSDLEIIASGLTVAVSKANGINHIYIDDTLGSDIIFLVKDETGRTHYRVFSCTSYHRSKEGPRKNYPAVAMLQDPDSQYDQNILNNYSKEPVTKLKPKPGAAAQAK